MKKLLLTILIIWPTLTFAGPSGGESGGLNIIAAMNANNEPGDDFIIFGEKPIQENGMLEGSERSLIEIFEDALAITDPTFTKAELATQSEPIGEFSLNGFAIDAIGAIKADQEIEWYKSSDDKSFDVSKLPLDLKMQILSVTNEQFIIFEEDRANVEVMVKDIYGFEGSVNLNWDMTE